MSESKIQSGQEFECQNCGCKLFNRVKPESGFAFAKDFQCRQCKEQVPAPVPLWGAWLMILGGGGLAILGILWTYTNATRGNLIGSLVGAAMLVFGARFAMAGLSVLHN